MDLAARAGPRRLAPRRRGGYNPAVQIYYINVAARTDRRAFMEAQFARLGLAATRIEAVTPADLTPAQIARHCDPRRGAYLMPPELCCGLSHSKALGAVAEAGAPFAVILEDDCVLSARLPKFLAAFETLAPPLDLLRLETTFEQLRLLPAGLPPLAGIAICRPYSWASGAGGYLVSRRGAALAAGSRQFWSKAADRVLSNPYEPLPRRLHLCQVNPALAVQAERLGGTAPHLPSNIHAERHEGMRLEHVHFWRRRPHAIANWINRDIVVGAQKAWHQYVRGARKQAVAFAPD